MVQSSFVKKIFGNSAMAEVNELKYINFTIFWMHIFHIYNLKSKWQNYANLVPTAIDLFSFGFKNKSPKKSIKQINVLFIRKKFL